MYNMTLEEEEEVDEVKGVEEPEEEPKVKFVILDVGGERFQVTRSSAFLVSFTWMKASGQAWRSTPTRGWAD